MAYRRCVTERAKLLYQQLHIPSFSYISHKDDNTPLPSPSRCFPTTRFPRHPLRPAAWRNMSTSSQGGSGEEPEMISNVEAVAAQVAPELSEVAVAAAHSFLPIANLQYFIEYVHITTGFNWWASIVVATLGIRLLTTPIMISQLKSTAIFNLLKPKLDEIKQEMQDRGNSQDAVFEGKAKMKELFKEYKVTPLTPLKGVLIQGPLFICFFFAIKNMAEQVPSFQHGGAYWFADLTTPDTTYIFPVLTALTFWMTVEVNLQASLAGNPAAKTIKNVARALVALTVPLTAGFAKAIFCYWISANVYSFMYGVTIKNPKVKELLGIPTIPDTPPSPNSQPSMPSFSGMFKNYATAKAYEQQKAFIREVEEEACKKYGTAKIYEQKIQEIEQQSLASASPSEASKGMNQKIPSSEILSQKLKSLQEKVIGRMEGGEKK